MSGGVGYGGAQQGVGLGAGCSLAGDRGPRVSLRGDNDRRIGDTTAHSSMAGSYLCSGVPVGQGGEGRRIPDHAQKQLEGTLRAHIFSSQQMVEILSGSSLLPLQRFYHI